MPIVPIISLLFNLLELLFDDSFTDASDLVILLEMLIGSIGAHFSHSSFGLSDVAVGASVEFMFLISSDLFAFPDSLDSSSSSE